MNTDDQKIRELLLGRKLFLFSREHFVDEQKHGLAISYGMSIDGIVMFTVADMETPVPPTLSRRVAVLEQLVRDLTKNPDFDFEALDYSNPAEVTR